jgi:Glycosyltransferase family 87
VVGLSLAYVAWRHGRAGTAGFALGFTAAIAKPQLVIGIAAYMVGRRDWRGIAGAVAGGAVTVAIGLVAGGPHGITSFLSAIATPHDSPTAEMQGSSGLFGSLLGQAPGVYFVSIAAGLAAAVVAGWLGTIAHRRADLLEPTLCGAAALSLFASPHLLGHDLTLLAPVLIAGLAWLAGRPTEGRWPGPATLTVIGGWALLSLASMEDLAQNSVGLPGRATPWALLLVAATWCALSAGAARVGVTPGRSERSSAVLSVRTGD